MLTQNKIYYKNSLAGLSDSGSYVIFHFLYLHTL